MSNPNFNFDELFLASMLPLKTCPETKEIYCEMPELPFEPLPDLPDYLKIAREQWFRMFDLMSEMIHVIAPIERYGKDNHVMNEANTNFKDAILAWPSSSVAETKNLPPKTSVPPKEDSEEAKTEEAKKNVPPKIIGPPKEDSEEGKTDKAKKNDSQDVVKPRVFLDEELELFEIIDYDKPYVKISDSLLQRQAEGTLYAFEGVALYTDVVNLARRPLEFFPEKVRRPAKRKLDDVELQAEIVLKKIKNADEREILQAFCSRIQMYTEDVSKRCQVRRSNEFICGTVSMD